MKGLSPEIAAEVAAMLARPAAAPGSCADLKRKEAQQLQLQALALLIEADEIEHVDSLCDADEAALRVLTQAQETEKQRAAAVKPAIAAERQAEDRLRDAVEYHRQMVAAERAVAGKGTPQEQAGALKDVAAAETVVQRERAAAEGAKTARVQAEADLEAARGGVAEAAQARDAAYARCDNPGRTPLSVHTCVNEPRLLLGLADKLGLTKFEKLLCGVGVGPLAQACGLTEEVRGEARREAEAEAERNTGPRVVNGDVNGMTVVHMGQPGGPQRSPAAVKDIPNRPGGGGPVVTPQGPGVVTPGLFVNPGVG